MTGPPLSIWRRNNGTTEPAEPRTLPNRTAMNFVSPDGYSLKVIAPLCGFHWRDGNPGGAQSELWYLDALDGDEEQRVRLLEYNEDDVAAQAAIRKWVRTQP